MHLPMTGAVSESGIRKCDVFGYHDGANLIATDSPMFAGRLAQRFIKRASSSTLIRWCFQKVLRELRSGELTSADLSER